MQSASLKKSLISIKENIRVLFFKALMFVFGLERVQKGLMGLISFLTNLQMDSLGEYKPAFHSQNRGLLSSNRQVRKEMWMSVDLVYTAGLSDKGWCRVIGIAWQESTTNYGWVLTLVRKDGTIAEYHEKLCWTKELLLNRRKMEI